MKNSWGEAFNTSCFFCKNEDRTGRSKKYREATYFYCDKCCKQFDLVDVITILPSYVHIFLNFKNKSYQVRLNMALQTTDIVMPYEHNHPTILKVPGFPITASNVKEKLSTYLVFL